MKRIIKRIITLTIIIHTKTSLAHTSINFYESNQGIISLSKTENTYTLLAIAGGRPAGGATAGNCIIMAKLKDTEKVIKGKLYPFKSSYFSYDEASSNTPPITLEKRSKSTIFIEVDTFGICGLGVTFTDIYSLQEAHTRSYKENFLETLKITHEIAQNLYQKGDKQGAITIMKPYAENMPMHWIENSASGNEICDFIEKYASFLQLSGQPETAINFLRKILEERPERTAAWLNLADTYWSAKKFKEARESYRKYRILMSTEKREKTIPQRVYERSP
ncbi:tetratricopeptide repeat protein [Metapseudomonas otitidis]|uniref:tetratricopeptide repeat protein n=1 Tax=Metapseudomonas otitidis TaxID=319939 RepID=UPI0025401E85|nr:tetratricopeptide repeat protein [Pseudomonas otitidis]WIF68486.1 tetratricopeptide repeat protein [Pseudomonas otitidis]